MTSEVTQAALEPCPFCGGMAVEETSKGPTGERYRWVQCEKCGAMSECCDDSARANNPDEPEPALLWNTRLTAQSGEGRSGAGEDAGPFHVSQSGDGKKLWFSARDPASGVTIPARDRTDARNLVSSLNHACATFAALNARQSGEGGNTLQHVAYYDEGAFHWMSGIAPRNCELYAAWPAALRATDDAGGAAKDPDTGEGE